ncbi:hypothetical protein TNIN_238141 [Trichonephila inaurata madagascariensis]|uniref:Uncharacterized protein n=1 Tax=Trichonephila inaurata madagascariensis TaxID=2747483 RepID=A0A8X7C3B2_9ARAC|nr:hypothetical protein TNIN_238141 [Trichonephila inaurata madagascariensis]
MSQMDISSSNNDDSRNERLRVTGEIEAHEILLSNYLQLVSTPDDEKTQEMKAVLRKAIKESAQRKDALLSNDENADFITLNNKLSTVREIIELSQLKHSYFTLPDDTDLKDALDVIIDLQEETQELKEKIVSTLGSEKVLQPSSQELTFEPNEKRCFMGSVKELLPRATAVVFVNGPLGKLKLRCIFDSAFESSFLTLHAAERLED